MNLCLCRSARIVALVLPFAVAAPMSARAASWSAIEEVGGAPPIRVLVNGKARSYFRVTPQAPLIVPVQGPVRFRIVSRAETRAGAHAPLGYSMRVSEGHRVLKEHGTESGPATEARLSDPQGMIVCKSRTFALDVPAGSHQLSVSVSGVPSVLVRLHVSTRNRPGNEMISITPVEASRSVTVSDGERLIAYYSVLTDKPVRLRLVGPATLELSSRLDYDPTMRGEQSYTLAISSGGRRIREVQFRTTKALTATYTNLKDRVPSKLDRIVVPVAPGLHELTVALSGPRGASAEIHARISQPVVGSEE